MKKASLLLVIIITALLVACRNTTGEQAAVTPDVTLALPNSTASPITAMAKTAATMPTGTQAPEEVVPAPATVQTDASPAQISALPAPTLFSIPWDDRSVFAEGLIPSETAVLQDLPGATIYHIHLNTINPNMVEGRMEARYTNQEDGPLSELALHLFPSQLGGKMQINDVQVNGQAAAADQLRGFLRVNLDEPLAPGQQIVLAMNFVTSVPGEEGTKYKVLAFDDDVLALAHFYPMFALYDDKGWHTAPSPPHGDETFSDASFYLVEVIAPTDQVLVASGTAVDRQETSDSQQVTFAAGPVRDFYLASSALYQVVQQQVGPVLVSSYAPGDRLPGAELALEVAANALENFGTRYGPYPYRELDIVSTPTDALGVEYPGIFANALRIYDLSDNSSGSVLNRVLLESTTAHETGHQWFYNLVASDQLNEPWLDESLTQYATWQYFRDRYGEQGAEGFYDNLEQRWARAEVPDTPIGLPAAAYTSGDYGPIVYGRGPIFLHELAEAMGQETFDAFLGAYSREFRWGIATSADFKKLAEQYCDCDLTDLFAEEVFGN